MAQGIMNLAGLGLLPALDSHLQSFQSRSLGASAARRARGLQGQLGGQGGGGRGGGGGGIGDPDDFLSQFGFDGDAGGRQQPERFGIEGDEFRPGFGQRFSFTGDPETGEVTPFQRVRRDRRGRPVISAKTGAIQADEGEIPPEILKRARAEFARRQQARPKPFLEGSDRALFESAIRSGAVSSRREALQLLSNLRGGSFKRASAVRERREKFGLAELKEGRESLKSLGKLQVDLLKSVGKGELTKAQIPGILENRINNLPDRLQARARALVGLGITKTDGAPGPDTGRDTRRARVLSRAFEGDAGVEAREALAAHPRGSLRSLQRRLSPTRFKQLAGGRLSLTRPSGLVGVLDRRLRSIGLTDEDERREFLVQMINRELQGQ